MTFPRINLHFLAIRRALELNISGAASWGIWAQFSANFLIRKTTY